MAELVPSPEKEPITLPPAPSEEPPIDPASLPPEDATAEDHHPCRFFQEGCCRFGTRCRNYHAGAAYHSEDHVSPHCPSPQPPSGKKPPMKTADDVISRILWDAQVPTECFSIGYLDRFLGILEEPFTAFSWEDLASVGPAVLAIPKHRIQYFKYRSRLVWDKASRTDDVFGSTGSGTTILEVIKEEKEAAVAAEEKVHTDSSNGDGGKVVGTEGQEMAEQTEAMEDSCSTRNREEWLDRGTDGPEMDSLNPDGITPTSLDEDVAGEEARAMVSSHTGRHSIQEDITEGNGHMVENEEKVAFTSGGKSFPLPKHRPTHFIAIQITSPEIREAVKRFQGALGDIRPDLAEFCVDVATLHLTLCLLHLDSPEEIHNAITALQELQANSQRLLPPALLLSFQGVENFNSRVLYTAPASAPQLGLLARTLQDAFKKKGLMVIHPPYKEKFHLTMVKIPARKGRPQLPAHSSWVPSFEDLGTQAVEALYLCEMGQGRKTDGFYTTLLKLDLY